MIRILKSRNMQITLTIFILMTILSIRLFDLTVLEHGRWSEAASGISVKNIYTPAPRGEIYDKYGNLLAGNMQTFALQVTPADLEDDESINYMASEIVSILKKNRDS